MNALSFLWDNGWRLQLFALPFLCLSAIAQLSFVKEEFPQSVFSGSARKISMTWSNSGSGTFEANVRGHVEQATSATAAAVADFPWRKLQVLPGQTVLESAQVDFPDVRARTEFLVQWLDQSNHVLGLSRVFVYPTNLLQELRSMAGDEALGVFDPANILKPLLKALGIEFTDLEDSGIAVFRGKLAIIGPFTPDKPAPKDLSQRIMASASRGGALVWLRMPPKHQEDLEPSFYSFTEGKGFVTIAEASLVKDLRDDPVSQLNLLSLCRRTVKGEVHNFGRIHSYEN